VINEGRTVGWVLGHDQADRTGSLLAASLLAYVVQQESEKKSLAGELLDRYRELHLLYNLSEHLAVSPQPADIAAATLQEVMRVIPSESGLILLNREAREDQEGSSGDEAGYTCIASRGTSRTLISNCCVIEHVLLTGKAELANSVLGSDYFEGMGEELVSVACAPLKTKESILGAVILFGGTERAFTAGDLKLLNAIAQQAAPAIEISRLYQVALENARIEHELKLARQVQESLLPAELPKISGWSFDTRWRPAWEVSGDFYDLIEEPDGKLGLVIGDVTGKGLSASLFMVFARSAVRASIGKGLAPVEIMANSNRLIGQESHEGLFATLFFAQLNPASGELTFSNAGHPLPLLVPHDGREILALRSRGMPLGALLDSPYEQHALVLQPGDSVLFYTDGVTETFDANGDEFGEERLLQVLRENRGASPGQVLDAVEQAVFHHSSGGKASDDLTLLIIQRG